MKLLCVLSAFCLAGIQWAGAATSLVTFFDGTANTSYTAPVYKADGIVATGLSGRPGQPAMQVNTALWGHTFPDYGGNGNKWFYFSSIQYESSNPSADSLVNLPSCNSRIGLTITPDAGKSITYTTLTFDLISIGGISGRDDTMNVYYNAYYKKAGDSDYTAFYSSDLKTGNNTAGAYGIHDVTTQTLDISALGTLDTSVEIVLAFALYGPETSGRGNRTLGINQFSINGTVADSIPEPSAAALALLGLAGLGFGRFRRK